MSLHVLAPFSDGALRSNPTQSLLRVGEVGPLQRNQIRGGLMSPGWDAVVVNGMCHGAMQPGFRWAV